MWNVHLSCNGWTSALPFHHSIFPPSFFLKCIYGTLLLCHVIRLDGQWLIGTLNWACWAVSRGGLFQESVKPLSMCLASPRFLRPMVPKLYKICFFLCSCEIVVQLLVGQAHLGAKLDGFWSLQTLLRAADCWACWLALWACLVGKHFLYWSLLKTSERRFTGVPGFVTRQSFYIQDRQWWVHGELAGLGWLEDALTMSEDSGSLESGAEWP